MELLGETYLGNRVSGWLTAVGVFVAMLAILWLARRLVSRHLEKLAGSTKTVVDDVAIVVLEADRASE